MVMSYSYKSITNNGNKLIRNFWINGNTVPNTVNAIKLDYLLLNNYLRKG